MNIKYHLGVISGQCRLIDRINNESNVLDFANKVYDELYATLHLIDTDLDIIEFGIDVELLDLLSFLREKQKELREAIDDEDLGFICDLVESIDLNIFDACL